MNPSSRDNGAQRRQTVRQVLAHIRRYRLPLAVSVLLALVSVAQTLYIPLLIGDAVDCAVGAGAVDFSRLAPLLLRIALCAACAALAQWCMSVLNNRIVFHVVRDVRVEAFTHVQSLPLSYLDAHPSGALVSRIITDADQFADGLLLGFSQLFTGVVTILGTLVFMLTIHPLITAAVVVLTPVSLLVARFIARRTYGLFRTQSEIRAEETALVDEALAGQKTIAAFSHEEATLAQFDGINDRLEKCARGATFFSSLVNPSTRFVNSLVYAAVALTGALAVIGGTLTVGGLSCFLSYAAQYAKPFNEISGVITELKNAFVSAERVYELLETAPEPDPVKLSEKSGADGAEMPEAEKEERSSEPTEGHVEFRDISFGYVPEKTVLRDFTLEVRPGEHIALVGKTGCGKTTLINLLLRFYETDRGDILIDGVSVRGMSRETLRAKFGMVLQDTWIFAGTVRENIRIGRPDATDEEVRTAARRAHADSFIRLLPEGYDTVLQENGSGLSEGQKQLLSISRVMLALPPMLVLDEATSSIDTRTEKRIQNAFNTLMEGRTSFIVAHRLSTIENADRILVLADGRIAEQGSHEELLERKGLYYDIYQSQFKGSEV